jgi:hypothetical protein
VWTTTPSPTVPVSTSRSGLLEELGERGVEFTREISDQGFGLMTALRMPGGSELALYEPRHPGPLTSER